MFSVIYLQIIGQLLCASLEKTVYNGKLKESGERFIATGENVALFMSPGITALNKIYVTEKH